MYENPFTPDSQKAKKSLLAKKQSKKESSFIIETKIKRAIFIDYQGLLINKSDFSFIADLKRVLEQYPPSQPQPPKVIEVREKITNNISSIITKIDPQGHIVELNCSAFPSDLINFEEIVKLKKLKRINFGNNAIVRFFILMSHFAEKNPKIEVEFI